MTTYTTPNFGFVAVYNAVPSTSDWAATYWNWIFTDSILYAAAVSHKHDGTSALQNPTGTLVLSTGNTGGYLKSGVTYYIAVTYVDEYMRETLASDIVAISTAASISAPATPTHNDGATPTDLESSTPVGLTGNDYWYKISYLKDGGESLPSSPVYISIPTDTLYKCTIHFSSLATVANGADTIRVYRKISSTGSWVKIADITNTSTTSYTDDYTATPACDTQPKTISTIGSFNIITIDWSALDFTEATYVKIYATTTVGVWEEASRITSVAMNTATPVTSYIWTGTSRITGKPPVMSGCYPSPSKIMLTDGAEIQGTLPFSNLPITQGSSIADVAESATPTPEQTKINEILAVLRTAGIIST
jgi:hypothetical protein